MEQNRPPLYVLPGSNPGLIVRGNIDINHRPPVRAGGGKVATVLTVSFELEADGRGYEVLVPRVINGRIVTPRQAFLSFQKTGRHLGIFDSAEHANSYGVKLHKQQAALARSG